MVSEIFFTILRIACHIGSSADFAITNEKLVINKANLDDQGGIADQ